MPTLKAAVYSIDVLIIEGMDGSGKSSLVSRLAADCDIPIHTRASDSIAGPVMNLWEWAENDVSTWPEQKFSIYDRHPLVSEYIYGPVTRGRVDERFFDEQYVYNWFTNNCVLIYCDPGWEEVYRNLIKDPRNQMAGVLDNSKRLYLLYKAQMFQDMSQPGRVVLRWDYTNPDNYDLIYSTAISQKDRHGYASRF